MIKYIILTLFLLQPLYCFSKESQGFYVTNNHDTIQAVFDIGYISQYQTLNCTLRNKVKVIKRDGNNLIIKPNEIKSFTVYNEFGNSFLFESIEYKGKRIFAEVIKKGKNISLYYYDEPGHRDLDEIFPSYLVKYKNKEIRHCNKKRAFLKYVDNDPYFVERFEGGSGGYKYLLLSFIDDYNNLDSY